MSELLETAFRRFERAAQQLEQRHRALEAKAEQLERCLMDANRRLEAVLDAVDGGVAVVASDGTILRTNRAFDQLSLGVAGGCLVHPALAPLLASAGTTRFRLDSQSGPRDLAATLVPAGDGEDARVLTVQDVTRIRLEEEEGGRRHHLEALGRMAAELAHEVRNPLGGIRLLAEMLHQDAGEQPAQREMIEQILMAVSGLEATVSNLLSFAAPAHGGRREIDLASVVRDAASLFTPACASRGVRLVAPRRDATCPVEADPEGLRQIVLNLLGNALAATERGGSIELSARRDGGVAVLEVLDTGKGIAPEDLPKVFDPFFSRTDGGTGLGLSIVHGIVERHGGRISLDSRVGAGTRARVEIAAGTGCERSARTERGRGRARRRDGSRRAPAGH